MHLNSMRVKKQAASRRFLLILACGCIIELEVKQDKESI
jgi:hypothetical protein